MRSDIAIAAAVCACAASLVLGCSKDDRAPPPVAGCTMIPDNLACERENGDCVPLKCIDQNLDCAPDEALIVLAPGRCSKVDAGGGDAGGAD
jgi:hypothetical protein